MPVPLAVHTNMNVLNHHICADAPYPISAGHVPGGASLSLEVPLLGPPVTKLTEQVRGKGIPSRSLAEGPQLVQTSLMVDKFKILSLCVYTVQPPKNSNMSTFVR